MDKHIGPESRRTLIYIPVIHTRADMGALSRTIDRFKIQKLGRVGWARNVSRVDQFWAEIEHAIDKLALPYERVRVYQDGLPVCDRELEIVQKLASAGSRNHRLVLCLMEKGATIMGTESSDLLVEEYQFAKEGFASGAHPSAALADSPRSALRDSLLQRRDQHIAGRINQTLQRGETGLMFLGMLHSLQPWLDKDIRVIYPIYRPLNGRGNKQ